MNELYPDATFDTTYSKINVRLAPAPSRNLAAAFLLQIVILFCSFINRFSSKDLEQMV
jgi:hypothetical protein